MKINEAPLDRAIRGVLGVAVIATPIMGLDTTPLNWLGFVLFATAIAGVCPLYKLLGVTTVRPGSYFHQKEGLELPSPGRAARVDQAAVAR